MEERLESRTMMEDTGKIKVLILEDQESDSELMARTLRKSGIDGECQRVENEVDYRAALEDMPNIILADFSLPGFDALRALNILKERDLDIPFIVVSGTISETSAVECLKKGADDYLLKDRLGRLGPAVMSALRERKLKEWKGKAERAAEYTSHQWKVTFDAIASPVFMLDRDGRILKCNQSAEMSLGRSLADMAGFLPCFLVSCPLQGGEHCPVQRMWESQRRETADVNIGERWYTASADPVFNEEGEVVGAVHILSDITQRRRSEEKLRESEERYRLLVESSPDVILVHQEGKVVFINTSGARMAGVGDPVSIIGRPIMSFIHPDNRELVAQRVSRMMAGETSLPPIELKLLQPDGKTTAVEVSSVPCVFDLKPAVLVFMRDLSERRRLEAQLHQSQKLESLGRLAGGIAHDFNNLLTVVMANSELLLMKGGREERDLTKLKIILETSERASHLTRQLLAFSSNQEMDAVCLDASQIIKEMKKMIPSLVGEDIECRFELAPEGAGVKADPSMIEQIIMNLVVNARDAMPKGGLLAVSTSLVDIDRKYVDLHTGINPGEYVMITVSDTGVGMPPEVQERIFEPFFTTKGDKGTGLGLATVYGHVKKLGGHINCYSEVGQGTEFKIYLPACRDGGTESRDVVEKSPDLSRGNEKVLLVEDEAVLRESIHMALEKLGYRVFAAADPEEAKKLMAENGGKIDLLLTDVIMPKQRGDEMTAEMKRDLPTLRVIFMSGYTPDRLSWDVFRDQGINFLNKPFTVSMLALKVREVLDCAVADDASSKAMSIPTMPQTL